LWNADVVITATGYPELLTERHLLPQHRLVIDCGYVPMLEDGKIKRKGDIDRNAVHIPQHYTPVPGGTGPMEMIILGERAIIATIDPTLAHSAWQLPNREFLGREAIHQLQSQWAEDLYPTAQALFDRHTDVVQTEGVERILTVAGEGDYRICMNDADQTLTILAAEKRQSTSNKALVLARFNRMTGEVEGDIKLNEQDHRCWQGIAASLNRDIDRRTSDSIDRTEPDAPDNPPPSAPTRPRLDPQGPSGGISSEAPDSAQPRSPQTTDEPSSPPADSSNSTPRSKEQEQIARGIYPVALKLSNHPSAVEIAPGVKEVQGDYQVTHDRNQQQLSIRRNDKTKALLAKYDTQNGNVIAADGLTEGDRLSWREIAQELDLQSAQVQNSRSTQSKSKQGAKKQKGDKGHER
jgi:hypothetical protein